MLKITHAAGHALCTPGKQSPDGYKEWQYTNEIVKLIMLELANYEGVAQKRIDDPTGKVDYSLKSRTDDVNGWGSNLHIDYHMNAFGNGWTSAGGTEVFVYKKTLKEAYALAQKVQSNLISSLGFFNRGVKEGDLHMIRETKPTSILIEFAFMSNNDEAMKMRTAEYQKKAAQSVVEGIVAQYGLKKKPGKLVHIYTGGYGGEALATVQAFIAKNKWWYQPSRNPDGTLSFLVGGFAEGSEAAVTLETFLKERNWWYQIK